MSMNMSMSMMSMNMNDENQESLQFWSSILQSLTYPDGPEPNGHLHDIIGCPLLVMSTKSTVAAVPSTPTSTSPSIAIIEDGGDNKADAPDQKIAAVQEEETNKEEEIAVEKEDKEKEEEPKEGSKNLGKRPRVPETHNMAEKRRRAAIRSKLQKLKQMTPNCTKKDISSILDSIIEHIKKLKHFVENSGPMMPMGMGMDFPRPWIPFIPPNMMMPFVNFGVNQGETSCSNLNHQFTLLPPPQEFNNSPPSSKSF